MEKLRKAAGAYFALQGLAVMGWWVLLAARPESREWFRLEDDSLTTLWAFWLPDLLLIGPFSFVASYLIHQESRYADAAAWLVTGAVTYATLYTTAIAMMTDVGWLGVVLMLPATLWSGVFATGLTVGGGMFRQAKAATTNYVLLKTLTQIAVVWTLILAVFPHLITVIEARLGIATLQFPYQRPLATAIFAAISILGVWAAVVMSREGRGTPLPLDHAAELVVEGPYRHVRNPMAVSGIGQGLCVALFLGSPLVAVYALMGSAIWQFVFRPLEEDDLERRFGERYDAYRSAVKCWVPRMEGYSTVDRSPVRFGDDLALSIMDPRAGGEMIRDHTERTYVIDSTGTSKNAAKGVEGCGGPSGDVDQSKWNSMDEGPAGTVGDDI